MSIRKIINDVKKLPLNAFIKDSEMVELTNLIQSRRLECTRSPEYVAWLNEDTEKKRLAAEKKAMSQSERDVERCILVRTMVESGELKSGDFIKVRGTRDRGGIRQIVGIEPNLLMCKQWCPAPTYVVSRYGVDWMRTAGYRQIDGMWVRPEHQLTTHEFKKFVKKIDVENVDFHPN